MTRRLSNKADQIGKSVWSTLSYNDNFKAQAAREFGDFNTREKRRSEVSTKPYQQPTQVDKSSRLRRAR